MSATISGTVSVASGSASGMPRPNPAGVLQIPRCRVTGALRARPGSGLVDLVVDIGDVVDEPHGVPLPPEPPGEPHEDHERPRVPDVCALVDRRAADVDADRLGRRWELDEGAAQRVVETHPPIVDGGVARPAPGVSDRPGPGGLA